jgi:hypothetical protein
MLKQLKLQIYHVDAFNEYLKNVVAMNFKSVEPHTVFSELKL